MLGYLNSHADRVIYEVCLLQTIRKEFPDLKLGVFAGSPRTYAEAVLESAYPEFEWDIIIAYEDVKRTKPQGLEIVQAMDHFQLQN